jgi:putative membrane protein
MTMILDAVLAYFHFAAIFVLFAYMVAETVLLRGTLDAERIRRLGRIDIIYFGAAMAVLATGFLRAIFGMKGPDYYFSWWPIYAKLATFIVIAAVSVIPTLAFIRWRRTLERDPAWKVPAEEQRKMRRIVMLQLHLAALIPVFAVIMARGIGRST